MAKEITKISELIPDDKNLSIIPIDKLDGMYLIDMSGNVYTKKSKSLRTIKQYISPNGYVKVNITHNKKNINLLVHRLIAITYLKKESGKEYVNHKDGNKKNNSIENLEWCTILENARHARETGLTVGVPTTEKTKQKLSIIHKEKWLKLGKSYNAKKVINTTTGKTYNCLKEAALTENRNYSYLCEMVKGRVKNNSGLKYL